ncbi:DUF1853 family protein [Cupriavidus sp. IDO]|uniref:DUF1853 family protein n=1 Tax=Cupriavidus sp. IDO TaxID=1539142 RepID=UPI0005799AC5|nr:DUF1853 family protein [Cupriavidus sp. IDO]KWR91843.1 hypothetical protein RM96_02665 [Cupriavidus sp. IDO]
MTVRELGPDLAVSPGGDGAHRDAPPLWRHAASPRTRDLAWCTLSPQLLAQLPAEYNGDTALARWPAGFRQAWQGWLQAADPAVLPATITELASGVSDQTDAETSASRSLRLGRHAERLLHFGLRHGEGLELLAANLPVRRAGSHGVQTLGELDFVWRDTASGAVVHWEMAAKFYLMVEPEAGAPSRTQDFVGPNLVDRLGDKLDHIVHRQLPLARTPQAQALLGRSVDRSEVYLLGWLFYRNGHKPADLYSLGIADDHLHGWWSSLEEWAARAGGSAGTRWCRLQRSGWLSGALVADSETESVETLRDALAQRFADPHHDRGWRRESPVMLCELEPAGPGLPGLWRERSRGFVVPPGWEARARARAAEPAVRQGENGEVAR